MVNRYSAFSRGETYTQFYRKAVTDAVGGFDPLLGPGTGLPYGCGEDTDYLLRALERGFVIARAPLVRVFHPKPDTERVNVQKIRSYAAGRMYLLRKHSFPLWFKLLNIVYPLLRLLLEGPKTRRYRTAMFLGRLRGFFGAFAG